MNPKKLNDALQTSIKDMKKAQAESSLARDGFTRARVTLLEYEATHETLSSQKGLDLAEQFPDQIEKFGYEYFVLATLGTDEEWLQSYAKLEELKKALYQAETVMINTGNALRTLAETNQSLIALVKVAELNAPQ